ncbi:CHASE3 domain-containing protein [Microvirga sp. BT689]|nr:CHASE3 domain-containing protein [Microvirga arvi]
MTSRRARGFALSLQPEYLQPYSVGLQVLEDHKETPKKLDRFVAETTGGPPGTRTVSTLAAHFKAEIAKMIEATRSGSLGGADQRIYLDATKATMDTLRQYVGQACQPGLPCDLPISSDAGSMVPCHWLRSSRAR